MLSPDDAQLTARDPALKGLATVLDSDALLGALTEARPELELGRASPTQATWKPGHRATAGYRVIARDNETHLFAQAWPEGAFVRRAAKSIGHDDAHRVLLPELAVSIDLFPYDSKLGTLAELVDPVRRRRLLVELLPGRPDLWGARLRPITYRVGRRFVASLADDSGTRALVKVYRGQALQRATASARWYSSIDRLVVPRVLATSERRGVLVREWLHGQPLGELIDDPTLPPTALGTVGAVLATLHSQPADGLPQEPPRSRAVLRKGAEWMSAVCPDFVPTAHRVAARLDSALSSMLPVGRAIHGDFSAPQVLLDSSDARIIDVDSVQRGDPAMDLGSFLSDLEWRVFAGTLARPRARALRDQLLAGYRGQSGGEPLDGDRLRLHTAAFLFGSAPGFFKRRHANWIAQMRGLVERAGAIQDEA